MAKWILENFEGIKTWYSGDVIDRIKQIIDDEICPKCPAPCLDKGVELCGEKQILNIIESEEK